MKRAIDESSEDYGYEPSFENRRKRICDGEAICKTMPVAVFESQAEHERDRRELNLD